MKRTLSLVSLVLCVLLLCTACSGSMTFAEYHKDTKYVDLYPALNTMAKIPALSKMEVQQSCGKILQVADEETVKFYDVETDQFILTFKQDQFLGATFFEVYGYIFFAVAEGYFDFGMSLFPAELLEQGNIDTTIKVTIYDINGTAVATSQEKWIQSCTNVSETFQVEADLIQFGSTIYRVAADGTVAAILDNPFFGDLPDIDSYTAEYYYCLNGDEIYVYDKSLNCTFIWRMPYEDAEVYSISHLAGNHVLVQYALYLPASEEKYDLLFDETEKCLWKSLIIDAKTGSAKEVSLNYILEDVDYAKDALISHDYERTTNKKVDTFAIVYMIENNRIMAQPKYVSINSTTGQVEFEIFTDLQGSASLIAADRYRYNTYNGDTYLMDGQGKIISKINALDSSKTNNAFICANGKVYNYNLEMVFDYEAQDLELVRMLGHSILFKLENGTFLLYTANGEVAPAVPEAPVVVLSRNQFYILQSGEKLTVFAEDGSTLGTLDTASVSTLVSGSDYTVLKVTGLDGTLEYYKLYAAPETN